MIKLLALCLLAAAVAIPARAADEPWLKPADACWQKVPAAQAARLKTILRGWPEAVRREAGENNKAFPCNIVLAVSFADHEIHRHILANPMPKAGGWLSMDRPAGDVIAYDPRHPDQIPGFHVDADVRTMGTGAKETFVPRGDTHRRDCIGMQLVAMQALGKVPGSLGIEGHMLVLGNEALGRFSAAAGSYALGLDPIHDGVHHVVGFWPTLRKRDAAGAIPEYALILDYWPMQDAADADDVMSKAQFTGVWSGHISSGELRIE